MGLKETKKCALEEMLVGVSKFKVEEIKNESEEEVVQVQECCQGVWHQSVNLRFLSKQDLY